jgi:hypothetical protein
MRHISLLILVVSLSAPVSPAQKKPPSCEAYSVAEKHSGKHARVDVRSPQARMFRTMLRDIAKKGAKFAGHYAIGYWGCGTECLRIGIVNLRTGRTYVSPFFASVGITYRLDSQMLIVAAEEQIRELYGDEAPKYLHPRYYILRNDKLILVYPQADIGNEAEAYWK